MGGQQLVSRMKSQQMRQQVHQIVKQEQSLEMVQSLLLVSLTSICQLRDLVPEEAFIRKEFAFNTEGSRNKTPKPAKFNVLAAGKSPAADKLLRWLDGIGDALGKGFLDSTQLSIIPSKERTEHVIESYTFKFGYGSKGADTNSPREVSSLNISQNQGASITVQSARFELGKLISYLIQLCQTMPELPIERFMTVHLFYNDRCPTEYQPAGFAPNNSSEMLLVNNTEWQLRNAAVGSSEFGQHRVDLNVSYLLPGANEPGKEYKEFQIPDDLPHTEPMQRNKANIGRLLKPRTASNVVTSNGASQESSGTDVFRKTSAVSFGKSQTSVPLDMKAPLSSQTSTHSQERRLAAGLLEMAKKGVQPPVISSTQPVSGEISFEPELDFRADIGAHLFKRHDSASGNGSPEVVCECGSVTPEGHLVECICCNNVQHRHCYASEYTLCVKQHVCYTCLLAETNPERLPKLKYTTQLRRLLWTIRKVGDHTTASELARQTGYERALFNQLGSDLKKQGIVKENKKRNMPPFSIINTSSSTEPGKLLHPLYAIADLYRAVTDAGSPPPETEPNREYLAHAAETHDQFETEVEVVRSDDETVADELKSLGPKTPVQPRRISSSFVLETPKHSRLDEVTEMGPPAKRARLLNSSQAMSPANVSRCDA